MQRKQRKLLRRDVMSQAVTLADIGVPVTRIATRLHLNLSRPALVKLLQYGKLARSDSSVAASLYPEWLDPNGERVQTPPANVSYVGFFPLGEWYAKH